MFSECFGRGEDSNLLLENSALLVQRGLRSSASKGMMFTMYWLRGFLFLTTFIPVSGHLPLSLQQQSNSCINGWREVKLRGKTRCLRVVVYPKTNWWDAEEECQKMNGHLLSVKNKTEFEDIKKKINETQQAQVYHLESDDDFLWIGLGHICPYEDLKWSDGLSDDKSFRPIGNVDLKNNSSVSCIAMKYGSLTEEKSWFYKNCSERRSYVCSAKPIPMSIGFSIQESQEEEEEEEQDEEYSGPCGDLNWCYNEKQKTCYRIHEKPLNFDGALSACRMDSGADLASIHSPGEVDYIAKMISYHPTFQHYEAWLGLNKLNYDGAYEWTDGTPLDHLTSVESLDSTKSELHQGSCVSMTVAPRRRHRGLEPHFIIRLTHYDRSISVGEWRKKRCADTSLPAICMKRTLGSEYNYTKATPEPKKDPKHYCKEGWKRYNNFCYKLYGEKVEDRKNVKDAQDDCQKKKANLVSVGNVYEQGFVLSLLQESRLDSWLGLNISNGIALWSFDNTPFIYNHFNLNTRIRRFGDKIHLMGPDYSNFRLLFPNTYNGRSEVCVFMSGNSTPGFWETVLHKYLVDFNADNQIFMKNETKHIVTCENLKMAYICESHASEIQKVKVGTDEESCRNIYKGLKNVYSQNGSCYAFNENATSWEDAEKICRGYSENSSLVHIKDIFDWSFVYSRAREAFNYSDFWIGLKNVNNSLKWSTGGSPRISPWGSSEPSTRPDMKCVSGALSSLFVRGPHWKMDTCESKYPFACKADNDTEAAKETVEERECTDVNWIKGGSSCYLIKSEAAASGYQAAHNCFSHYNATLASFESKDDFDAVASHLISKPAQFNQYYIGLVQQLNGEFAWLDRTPLTFTNWNNANGPLTHQRRGRMCVSVDTTNQHSWHIMECYNTLHYICSMKRPAVTKAASTSTTTKVITGGPQGTTPQPQTTSRPRSPVSATPQPSTTTAVTESAKSHKLGDSKSKQSDKGVSGWAGVGIAACVLFFILLAFFGFALIRKKKIRFFGPREPGFMHFDTLQQEDDGY